MSTCRSSDELSTLLCRTTRMKDEVWILFV